MEIQNKEIRFRKGSLEEVNQFIKLNYDKINIISIGYSHGLNIGGVHTIHYQLKEGEQ